MKRYQGVAITDGKNRKNHIIPLSTIINSYGDTWSTCIPMNLGHDRTKPIGYTVLSGIYMEPGKAYLTNESAFIENDEEYEQLIEMIKSYDYNIFYTEHKKEIDILIKKLGSSLSNEFRVAPIGQAVAIRDKDIVSRLFPEWSKTIKDGLADICELEPVYKKGRNGEKGFLVPGVYQKEGYLIFAHQFFRRNLSILNTTNEEFFYSFEKMRDVANVELKIAIDMDMIGLLGTEQLEVEYQYIRGPHFNEDLTCIPKGVTCYDNEHYDNLFSNIISTQFYWYIQDDKKTFECEELCDKENISFDDGNSMLWGCRYVHSMVNPCTGLPTHLDGAIRIYDDEQIIKRIDLKTDISKYGKNSKYIKLWRIDNDFPVSTWKKLISSFYRENDLVGEYFGGVDKKYDNIKKKGNEHNSMAPKANNFDYMELSEGDGIRIFFRYTNNFNINDDEDIKIYNKESIVFLNGQKIKILDIGTVTLLKYLKRKGLKLRNPLTSKIDFNDTIFNFPTLCCKNFRVMNIVIDSIKELCQLWASNSDDRLISFGLMINLTDKSGHISFAGHVNDFVELFKTVPSLSDITFEDWVEAIYEENNKFKKGEDYPNKFNLINGDVVCFRRHIVNPDKISNLYAQDQCDKDNFNMFEKNIYELSQHKIICEPFYRVTEVKCKKCGRDYFQCPCVKYIDKDVYDEVINCDFGGLIWKK